MEPSVEFGGEAERAAGGVECVTGVFIATESATDSVVERDVWEACAEERRSQAWAG
jgi:hypothetical protein